MLDLGLTERPAEVAQTETKTNSESDDRDNFCPQWKIVRKGYEVNADLAPAWNKVNGRVLAVVMRIRRKRFCRPKKHCEYPKEHGTDDACDADASASQDRYHCLDWPTWHSLSGCFGQ